MHRHYADLLALTSEPPKWWDDNAVPRWCEFSPHALGVYIDQAALIEIKCQACERPMLVAASWGRTDATIGAIRRGEDVSSIKSLADFAESRDLRWGDPPNHNCGGDSMSSEPVRVVEFWDRISWEWERRPELEVPLRGRGEGVDE